MYLNCFKQFVLLSFKDLSVFRTDFILSIVQLIVHQGIFIVFWQAVIKGLGSSLSDWSEAELALLVLSGLVFNAIRLIFFGFATMSQKILKGEIDKYLCRPISPLFAILAEDMQILSALHALFTCSLLFIGISFSYELIIHASNLLFAIISILLGSLMLIFIEGCVSLLSFWFGDVRKISYTINSFMDFQRYPITILPSLLQFFLTWVLPVALVSSIPVMILTGKTGQYSLLIGGQLVGTLFWLSLFFLLWKKALKSYDSMGG